jgi:hypothetical protein
MPDAPDERIYFQAVQITAKPKKKRWRNSRNFPQRGMKNSPPVREIFKKRKTEIFWGFTKIRATLANLPNQALLN